MTKTEHLRKKKVTTVTIEYSVDNSRENNQALFFNDLW